MTINTLATGATAVLTVSAFNAGVSIPSTSSLRRTSAAEPASVLVDIALDRLIAGFLPDVAVRPAILIVLLVGIGWWTSGVLLSFLQWPSYGSAERPKQD
jgi:hypothetical protein